MPIPISNLPSILSHRETATNSTGNALQVLCAWPLSSNYGIGSRVLYYILILACIVLRKAQWARNSCLVAVLLFPAVAAVHAIVLAAVHTTGAVDMDLYGTFQFCSIGILAAPVTVRLSRTYIGASGRMFVVMWTGLLMGALISLAVEFSRVNTLSCLHDDSGNLIPSTSNDFPYGTTCGLTCSIESGPSSPIRRGPSAVIYVIPIPHRLTIGAAALLAAACCVPAVISLVSGWLKMLDINWTRLSKDQEDEPIEGTNGATRKTLKGADNLTKRFLSTVEVFVFASAVLAVIVVGERNFFSPQIKYQTKTIESIGQWGPIVGTVLAFFGALYLLLLINIETVEDDSRSNDSENSRPLSNGSVHNIRASREESTINRLPVEPYPMQTGRNDNDDRRRVGRALHTLSGYVGAGGPEPFDDADFRRPLAMDFPEIPGEYLRNSQLLPHTLSDARRRRAALEVPSPIHTQRTATFNSPVPGTNIEDNARPSSTISIGTQALPFAEISAPPRLSTSSSTRGSRSPAISDNSIELAGIGPTSAMRASRDNLPQEIE